MISIDANILLYSYCAGSPFYAKARAFLETLQDEENVALSEFVLAEFYLLLRNPAVITPALDGTEAGSVIAQYRTHPHWQILGFPPRSRELHDDLWRRASQGNFARRRIYDARIALSLRVFGVTDFATVNLKDFQDFGFNKVWNPLES